MTSPSFTVKVHAESLIATLKGFRKRFRQQLMRVMNQLTIEVQRSVKADKLSGQVLHVRTGTLRRSINRRVEEQGGMIIGSVGTNVQYAAAHEYGFKGVVTVKEHLRREKAHMKSIKFQPGKKLLQSKTKNTGFSSIIGEHTRKMNLPERSFLRSTLKQYEGTIRDRLALAAMEALVK